MPINNIILYEPSYNKLADKIEAKEFVAFVIRIKVIKDMVLTSVKGEVLASLFCTKMSRRNYDLSESQWMAVSTKSRRAFRPYHTKH